MNIPTELQIIILELSFSLKHKFRDFIQIDKLEWCCLSYNSETIPILEANPDKINCTCLSENPAANPEKIHWSRLSGNPAAIHLLEANQEKINWSRLLGNPAIFEPYRSQSEENKLVSAIFKSSYF